ncbi:MAG: hypothetical protein WC471_05920 [Candidatus Woesearchaeota archaeon]
MKVNNFSELDSVLKTSFSKIKEDMSETKKELNVELKEAEKRNKNSLDLTNTKIKFLADEIKKFKDYKNELVNEQRESLSAMKEESKSYKEELKADYKKELEKVSADTAKLKDNFVKVMDILKEKLVTKKSFEDNNQVIEKAILGLVEKTKDIEEIKFNYFEKLNINRQLTNVQEDTASFKDELSKSKELLNELQNAKQQLMEFKEVSCAKFVKEESFLNKVKDIEDLKESLAELNMRMAQITDQKSGSVDINLFNNEIEDIRKRLGSVSDFEEKLGGFAAKEELKAVDQVKSQNDELANEIASLRAELKESRELRKEVERLRSDLEKSQHKTDKNTVMIEMLQGTKSSVKLKEVREEPKVVEEIVNEPMVQQQLETPSMLEATPVAEEGSGLLKRTMKGIADFFLEEDDVFNVETPSDIKEEYGASLKTESAVAYKKKEETTLGDTTFVAEIEKMFDEKEEPQIDLKLEPEVTTNDNGFLDKLKKGVVNFFFEEVDDESFVFQSEEIEQEDEAQLKHEADIPKVEIVEEIPKEAVEVKEPKAKKAKKKEVAESSLDIETPQIEVVDVDSEVKVKGTPVLKSDERASEPKKTQYMRSKRPRIFDEIQAESDVGAEEPDLSEVNKPKKKAKKAVGSLAEEDYVYYPEDYFY